jgi:endonuclease/exonuclease/phosphatase family metal-dependent hydrolase
LVLPTPIREPTGRPRTRSAIGVATYNIRAAIGPGEPFPSAWWRHVDRGRLERIGSIIRDLDADVVSLQEVAVVTVDGDIIDQPAELSARTGFDARYAAVAGFPIVDPDDGRTLGACLWGNAILSRLPIRTSETLALPIAADVDLVEPAGTDHPLAGVAFAAAPLGSRERRCLLRVEVEGPAGPLSVVSTHLSHVGSGQRRLQAEAAAAFLERIPGPAVVAGDLNAAVEAPDLAALTAGLTDPFVAAGIPPGDGRRASCGPWRIDHLLARGMRPLSVEVRRDTDAASDHDPVVARFEIGTG